MNIELMRYLDYWVGTPICFLFSGIELITKATRVKKSKAKITKKILFVKLSELGAIILAHSLVKRVKEKYSSAEMFFVTFMRNRDTVILLNDAIPEANILLIREDSLRLFMIDTWRAIRRLRREDISVAFDLDFFSRFVTLFVYLTKAKKRIGLYRYTFEGLYCGNLLTHKIQYNPLVHISKIYLSFIQALEKKDKNTPELEDQVGDNGVVLYRYKSKVEIRIKLELRLRDYGVTGGHRIFLVNPGEGVLPLREWPLDNFIALSKMILEETHNYIIIVGRGNYTKKGESIIKGVDNRRCINLLNRTTLEELMELFCIAQALISNDSGLAHLAALTPVNKYIIFGPESPRIFAPLGENVWTIYSNWPCSPCLSVFNHRKSACKNNICLKVISPEDVYQMINKTPAQTLTQALPTRLN